MRLVEILARELKEWPAKECLAIAQDRNGFVYFWNTLDINCTAGKWGSPGGDGLLDKDWSCGIKEIAEDQCSAIVTRAQWQEAREALSKPADLPPVGATHYIVGAFVVDSWWMREPGDNWYVWSETARHWALDKPSVAQRNLMKQLPVKQDEKPWSGEGLPPAGTVCELRNVAACTDWAQATVVFASRNVVVWDWAGEPAINGLCTAYAHAVEMRPIRTPEQIAAEEREAAIAEMAATAKMATGFGQNLADHAALYDAGYRKVKDGNQET